MLMRSPPYFQRLFCFAGHMALQAVFLESVRLYEYAASQNQSYRSLTVRGMEIRRFLLKNVGDVFLMHTCFINFLG